MAEAVPRRGELQEIKVFLKSDKKEKRRDALKKVIGLMTVGKDVSSLFNDVLACLQSDKMEIKKLVYLYLMNHARSRPQLAILSVNSFIRDCSDVNPLIRALALRTMGCIRLETICEHFISPLRKCLTDEDPYVRKTAAICIAKFYAINPTLVKENGFVATLKEMLSDSNPMVVANTVAALLEIAKTCPDAAAFLDLQAGVVSKLLTALGECTEWGQIFIMDALAYYICGSSNEAQSICERVVSRLSHANAGVVLSAVKLILNLFQQISADEGFVVNMMKKMAPPLVTLLSFEPEIQYVALRNIVIIVQKYPQLLRNDIKAFFVKYNDPIYVKLEKLGILNRLASVDNISLVLAELKEYSSEVDVDFVKKSIRSIGYCALRVEVAADSCVKTLIELMSTKINYVVQEAVIVVKDILRRYPNRYENVIEKLSDCLNTLDEPEARASMIWILGEYSDIIEGAGAVLKSFFDGFFDEATSVQLQLLTSVVKVFLKSPLENQELVQEVLTIVTQQCTNPDVRDRGFIYWRLLSTDPNSAKDVVLTEKPIVSEETTNLENSLLEELIVHLTTLASIYHKTPYSFIQGHAGLRLTFGMKGLESSTASNLFETDESTRAHESDAGQIDLSMGDDLLLDLGEETVETGATRFNPVSGNDLGGLSGDLRDLNIMSNSSPMASSMMTQSQTFNFVSEAATVYQAGTMLLLDPSHAKGLEVTGSMSFKSNILFLEINLNNVSLVNMDHFNLFINSNPLGITMSHGAIMPTYLSSKQSTLVTVPLNFNAATAQPNPNNASAINEVEMAIQNNVGVFKFTVQVPFHLCFQSTPTASVDAETFDILYSKTETSANDTFETISSKGQDYLLTLLCSNFIFMSKLKHDNNMTEAKMFGILRNNTGFLVKAVMSPHGQGTKVSITTRCSSVCFVPKITNIISAIIMSA